MREAGDRKTKGKSNINALPIGELLLGQGRAEKEGE